MLVNCQKGFYIFDLQGAYERQTFENRYKIELVETQAGLTFPALAKLPDYSFAGQPYALGVALANYSGSQLDVMVANKMCYSLKLAAVVPFAVIADVVNINVGKGVISIKGLPQAYAISRFGVLESFSGYLDTVYNIFTAEKVTYASISG